MSKENNKKASEKITNKREPFAIVTGDDNIVTNDVYKQYAMKDAEGESTSPTRQLSERDFDTLYNEEGIIRPLYDPTNLTSLLEINTYHNRCTKTKSQDIAGTGWALEPKVDNPNEGQKEIVNDIFEDLFPPLSTELVKAEIDYQTIGYCYLELVREGDREGPRHDTIYKYINHAPGHTIRIHQNKKKFVQQRGGKTVWFKHPDLDKDVNKNNGKEHPLGSLSNSKRASEMIMMLNYTPRSNFYGLPNIIDALGAIQGNLAQRQYNNDFFRNHGIPNYAVYVTGDYDLEQDEEGNYKVIEYIKRYLNEVRNKPHSSIVFGIPSSGGQMGEDVEVHFEELSVNEKDASFRMYRKDNRNEIIISHGVPPYRIGITEEGSLGGNTAKESNTIYKESVVNPRQEEIEQYINRFILKKNLEIEDWKFKLRPLEFDSKEEDRKDLEFLFNNGGASPNDLIKNLGESYGIEPIDHPAMNAHYINGQPITNLEDLPMEALMHNGTSQMDIEQLFRTMKDTLSKEG